MDNNKQTNKRFQANARCLNEANKGLRDLMVRFLILFNFSLDIFDSPFLKETADLKDPSLCAKADNLKSLMMTSTASKKYSHAWSRWRAWPNEKIGVAVLPAQPLIKSVQSALSDLLSTSVTHGTFSCPSTKRGLILIGLELNTSARESFEHC